MKIAIATGIFPPDVGGPATFVPMIADAWTKRGWKAGVVTYSDSLIAPSHPFDVYRVRRALPVPLRYVSYVWKLFRASRGASAIFAQDGVASGFPAWLIAMLRRKRFVIKIVGDFAWEHARVQEGYEASIEAFQTDAKKSRRIRFMDSIQRFVARQADAVIVPSKYLGRLVEGWGVPESHIRVVYNGVEVSGVSGQLSGARNPHRIITAGRLVPWKGFDTLIAAMPKVLERVPDATLMIVGDGPREELLQTKAKALGVDHAVMFTGRMKREDLWQAIRESGVFALVSSYEGFSHQLVEAFHCGTPVVASRAGGNPELVEDGKNGLLVAPGDVAGTTSALLKFLEDPSLAERCTQQALEDAGRFTVSRQVEETTVEVAGGRSPRVLMLSRDASADDPDSATGRRLAAYAERVESFRAIPLVKGPFAGIPSYLRFLIRVIKTTKTDQANLIIAQDPFETGATAHVAALLRRVPYVIEDHGAFFDGSSWRASSPLNFFRWMVGRHVIRHASGVRTVSERARRSYESMRLKSPILVAPVATRLADKAPSPHVGPFTVLYAGRFSSEKNLRMLLAAFHKLHDHVRDARLFLVGAGAEEDDLRRTAAEYGVAEAVRFEPWRESLLEIFSESDVAALTSDREGYCRFVVEAMSHGLPVVMTDVGLAGEVVRNGTEGIVVPIRDTDAFGEALKKLSSDKMLRMMMREAAIRRTQTMPKPAEIAARVTDFWKSLSGTL